MRATTDTSERGELDLLFRKALKSQYHAALSHARQAIELCANSKWIEGDPPYWQVAYSSRQPRRRHVAHICLRLKPVFESFFAIRGFAACSNG